MYRLCTEHFMGVCVGGGSIPAIRLTDLESSKIPWGRSIFFFFFLICKGAIRTNTSPSTLYMWPHGLGISLNQPHYFTPEEAKFQEVQRQFLWLLHGKSRFDLSLYSHSSAILQQHATSANSELLLFFLGVWASEALSFLCLAEGEAFVGWLSHAAIASVSAMNGYRGVQQSLDFLINIQSSKVASLQAPRQQEPCPTFLSFLPNPAYS